MCLRKRVSRGFTRIDPKRQERASVYRWESVNCTVPTVKLRQFEAAIRIPVAQSSLASVWLVLGLFSALGAVFLNVKLTAHSARYPTLGPCLLGLTVHGGRGGVA